MRSADHRVIDDEKGNHMFRETCSDERGVVSHPEIACEDDDGNGHVRRPAAATP